MVTLDISCLACPQSQLDGCSRDQFRRVSTCSAGNGSSCPVHVEFLYLRLWCPLPLARGDLLQGRSPRIVLFAKLSPGLMSLAIMTTNLFQFRFADTEQYWHSSCLISLTLFRTENKHVPVWCAFACFEWVKLTLTASSGIPKKFLVGKRTWDQKLSSGLMLLNSRLPIPLCRY